MGSRREADDEKPRFRIPKTGNRPAPIGLAAVGTPLDAADFFAVRNQTGTEETLDDLLIERL